MGTLASIFGYAPIKKDELLGPIFNEQIPERRWPHQTIVPLT